MLKPGLQSPLLVAVQANLYTQLLELSNSNILIMGSLGSLTMVLFAIVINVSAFLILGISTSRSL